MCALIRIHSLLAIVVLPSLKVVVKIIFGNLTSNRVCIYIIMLVTCPCLHAWCVRVCMSSVAVLAIDGFLKMFRRRNWWAKVSCDADINQSTGSMVM